MPAPAAHCFAPVERTGAGADSRAGDDHVKGAAPQLERAELRQLDIDLPRLGLGQDCDAVAATAPHFS